MQIAAHECHAAAGSGADVSTLSRKAIKQLKKKVGRARPV